ncbi:hypothetical protein [Devosia sp. 2618]|uniref:hypothetical protein n=1 Tax=Devosia sp. 2618 TaxID=3156454 RepID=UPI003397FD7E
MSHWITDKLPWRAIVPQRGYFRVRRIAAACPEIRGELNRASFWRGARASLAVPVLIPLVPVAILHLAFAWLARWTEDGIDWARDKLPDFSGRIDDAVCAAHAKLSIEEIRERIGEPVARILSKKPSVPHSPAKKDRAGR